jgi:lipoprotein-anchoring transpeptidase ErfK/SrfK
MIKCFLARVFVAGVILATAILPSSAVPPKPLMAGDYIVGSIIIKTKTRQLVFVKSKTEILVYPIAVGKAGRNWTGTTEVSRKVRNPTWAPPAIIRRDNPALPKLVRPGPNNPLGAAVLVLGDGTYGIHGTNRDETIGTAASYGCFRMHNADVLALFEKVEIGTKVYVQ